MRYILVLNILLITAALSVSSCYAPVQSIAMLGARSAYDKGDCDKVLQLLSKAEGDKKPSSGLMAEISGMRASCLEQQGKIAQSRSVYRYIVNRWPDSEYADTAREELKKDKF